MIIIIPHYCYSSVAGLLAVSIRGWTVSSISAFFYRLIKQIETEMLI